LVKELSRRFRDARFMTADEKRKVLVHWERFIRLGFKFEHFTKALYQHLTLHCSFIAHYNRRGFYETYFTDPEQTIRFFQQFDREHGCVSVEYGMDYWLHGDCKDLNLAMCQVWDSYKGNCYIALKKAAYRRDIDKAKALLKKHDISVKEVLIEAEVGQQQMLF